MIQYEGADTVTVEDILSSRGVASEFETVADPLLESGDGTIEGVIDDFDTLIDRLNDRIDNLEKRLETRRDFLLRKCSRLEEALALPQSQSEWLTAQFANLPKYKPKS